MTHPDEYVDLAADYEQLKQENQRLRELLERCGKVITVTDNIEPAILIMDEKLIEDLAKELSDVS